ncbi:MAG: DNA translocase FtsK 4TM domain-containing protein [Planctomycetaceae bacterium]|nr:DNA translocase FtsK 4TM domain-containing protein [Planctomycetaceae bacterium]MBV8309827.1 DNA translocase FtsK 4TM domain-containing protein [Planctomycetaceae bacterium]
MPVRQRLLRLAPALTSLFLNLFLALSLVGYDPADAPGSGAEPANHSPLLSNPCGPVGATLAHVSFNVLGWSSWLLLLGLVAVNVLIVARCKVADRVGPALGFALLLAVSAGMIHKFAPGIRPSPPVGSGGYTGALVATFLFCHFGPYGMLLIMVSAGTFGLVLCHDVLTWPVREASTWARSRLDRRRAGKGQALRPGEGFMLPAAPSSLVETLPASPGLPARPALTAATNGLTSAPPPGPFMTQPHIANASRTSVAFPPVEPGAPYELPPRELLEPPAPFPIQGHETQIHARAMLLERTLLDFGYRVRVVQIDTGPVITQFEIELEAGLRVSRVMSLADDLAIALAVPSVRIVAPIPGKTTVGIEVPNDRRVVVRLSEVIASVEPSTRPSKIPLYLGKDVKGTPMVFDLADMPHLLMAGSTGTGKSVCLNAMILSILMTKRPDEVKLILVDPKKVELSQYKKIPHLMHPVVTDMKKAESILAWACEKMDERYELLRRAEVRNIQGYNQLGAAELLERMRPEDQEEQKRIPTHMPYIVIVADEMADLMMTAAKEVEQYIVRLAQLSRAVGMHLILATQKPVVDVVTGLIKGNMPARISFKVASRGDSRVILDEIGADRLLGNGDMLFLIPGTSQIVRSQGTYVSDAELKRVCQYLERYPVEFSREVMQHQVSGAPGKDRSAGLKERDELYEPAIEIVIREGRGSCSLLQRALGIGYGRAARLVDFMAEDGIVGEFKKGEPREVLYSWEEWEALKNGTGISPEAVA